VQMENDCKTERLKSPMEHFTYRGFDRYLQSVHQYARMAAEQMSENGRSAGILDLMFRPPAGFLKKYFLQLGCLDGSPGFVIAMLTAYGLFCRFAILRDLSMRRIRSSAVVRGNENHSN